MKNIGQEILSLVDGARLRGDKYNEIVKQINNEVGRFIKYINSEEYEKECRTQADADAAAGAAQAEAESMAQAEYEQQQADDEAYAQMQSGPEY